MKSAIDICALIIACAALSDAAQITRGPYLQSTATNRCILCWRTDVATTTEVAIGASPTTLGAPNTVSGTRTDHELSLTGLQPGTRYYYKITGTPASGTPVNVGNSTHWFETSPATGNPAATRCWVIGDSGYGYPQPINAYQSYLNLTTAEGRKTDLFLLLGDNAYDVGTDGQYQWAVFDRYATMLRNTPDWSAFGNHDAYTAPPPYNGLVPYDSIFRFPTAAECGGFPSNSERYYSFNHGNIHFICLDTNTLGNYDDVPGAPYGMVDWLLDDLKACDSDWIVAFMHLGPYSRGSYNSDNNGGLVYTRYHVVPLLETYGVDLVLSGHSHVYERSRLVDGHYETSATYNPATMLKWPGNGSERGAADAAGNFIINPATAGGAYQKAAATARSGAVYSVIGASSVPVSSWIGGSTYIVNPTPHVVHQTSLRLVGGLVLDVEGNRLNGRYFGEQGALHDDFTILKGCSYQLLPPAPIFEGGVQGVAFPVQRQGSVGIAESVPVALTYISGTGTLPGPANASFAAGETTALVKFFPSAPGSTLRFEAAIQPVTRSVQVGAAPRKAFSIAGGSRQAQFSNSPANTWFASRFGNTPPTPALWQADDDKDGLPLLLEYALGGEPGRDDSDMVPRGAVESGKFVMRYRRATGRNDVSYEALGSSNLGSWNLPGLVDLADGAANALGEPRRVELPMSGNKGFLRLKVTLPP